MLSFCFFLMAVYVFDDEFSFKFINHHTANAVLVKIKLTHETKTKLILMFSKISLFALIDNCEVLCLF